MSVAVSSPSSPQHSSLWAFWAVALVGSVVLLSQPTKEIRVVVGGDDATPRTDTYPIGAQCPPQQYRDGDDADCGEQVQHSSSPPRACSHETSPFSGHTPRTGSLASVVSSASRVFTSDSRNRRWPPGVRIDPIRPAVAQRVTVFGSTRNNVATSPGVSKRSLTC